MTSLYTTPVQRPASFVPGAMDGLSAAAINANRISLGTLNANVEVRLPLTVKQAAKKYRKALKALAEQEKIVTGCELALDMARGKARDARVAVNEARAELEKAAER